MLALPAVADARKMEGTPGPDNLRGGARGGHTINGDGGGDRISGGPFSDSLYGDSGGDMIFGQAGDDVGRPPARANRDHHVARVDQRRDLLGKDSLVGHVVGPGGDERHVV